MTTDSTDKRLDALILTDLHYVGTAAHACPSPKRQAAWGRVLLRKALLRVKHLGLKPDVLILLGDLLDNGLAPGAADDLAALAAEARAAGLPLLVVPGNHDGPADAVVRAFGCGPGLHEIGGYGFLVFHDHVGAGDVTTRPADDVALPVQVAAARPDLPLIALQHNPLHPPIESAYPYMLTNGADVLESYARANVLLSLSGHCHVGQGPVRRGPTTYRTVPALCESPFRFDYLRLRGRTVELVEHELWMEEGAVLTDVHCHTEFAYCGTTVNAKDNIALASAMGLGQVCLTEHAFQLYFGKDDAWSFRWQSDPAMAEKAWASESNRMAAYRAFARAHRGGPVRLVLEVDWRENGTLLLAPGDEKGWDLLIGGVHAMPGYRKGETSQAEAERLFMVQAEGLLGLGIAVLAHPFRIFKRKGLDEPVALHEPLAERLAAAGVAAEVNFHDNPMDERFLRACARHGVRVALGTDSHDLAEVGELRPHVELLKRAGLGPDRWDRTLFRFA